MLVKSKQYDFVSHWQIPASIQTVEAALLNTTDWQKWWDGLEDVQVVHGDIGVGSQFDCKWRSMTGYRISLRITITRYGKGRDIGFDSQGDLVGSGEFLMSAESENSTVIVINWNVATTKPWMNMLAPVLKPVFVVNHNKLMKQGEIGLANYIAKSHN